MKTRLAHLYSIHINEHIYFQNKRCWDYAVFRQKYCCIRRYLFSRAMYGIMFVCRVRAVPAMPITRWYFRSTCRLQGARFARRYQANFSTTNIKCENSHARRSVNNVGEKSNDYKLVYGKMFDGNFVVLIERKNIYCVLISLLCLDYLWYYFF